MYDFLKYKNVAIRYRDTGKGRVVVLLHGFLENSSMWNELVVHLSKQYRVVCIDLLGHGKSGNLGYIHTMEAQAQLVKAVLRHLRLRKYILVGHSMGGYISLAFAEMYPHTVKGLCLMNSTAMADSEEKKASRDRAIEAVKHNYKIFIRIAIPSLFAEENRSAFKSEISQLTREALKLSRQGIIASLEGMKIRKDRTALLKLITFQKLMIIGKKDPILIPAMLMKQVQYTNTKIIELPGGHMSHIENKETFANAIKEFVCTCN